MIEHEITQMQAGKKVHRVVRQMLPGIPLSGIYKMIRTGRVKLNGKKAKPDQIVDTGDRLILFIHRDDYENVKKSPHKFSGIRTDIEVLEETSDWLAVHKPAGVLTHGAAGEHKHTLVNQVAAYLYQKGDADSDTYSPAPLHRLDRNTSGIVLFAKNGWAAKEISRQIQNGQIEKYYIALVHGEIKHRGSIQLAISRRENNRTVISDASDARPARTDFEPIVSNGKSTVVCLQLITGRTHQIRAHMKHIGHALVDDVKYQGGRAIRELNNENADKAPHQWLHAFMLQMADGHIVRDPLPKDFRNKLQKMGYSSFEINEIDKYNPFSD
ncbi:RluA family pseudouridine synthase [Alicyclobacillus tolerans]|uniref:Pseudouridine synthase n=1 Tax=Alicyclobacillus tolerans TaxID=90970 RepID=A0A1M6RV06_9BACL|nr:RluA family pseudouridine synthase [Alicyclobacillus montanus]SHK36296.1 23S rRNA pseudouridine955/2504/2580 synthase [Alicyclobacillus montanus]